MGIWILFIICLVISAAIVNFGQQAFMKALGADMMFFSAKKKLIAIIVIALLLTAIIMNIFGIQVPN